jgi:glycosyltransferase involved in cell wall biosynthesis
LIPKLEVGGAERQLYYLAQEMSKRHYIIVVTFYNGGELWGEFAGIPNVKIFSLCRKNRWDFSIIKKIKDILKDHRIDVVQNFLPPAGFIGILGGLWAKVPVKINTIRCSNTDYSGIGSAIYFFLERLISNRFADIVIANSQKGKEHHVLKGYKEEKIAIVYNGIDIDKFKIACDIKLKKEELGIYKSNKVVGIIARIDPMKDHKTFLQAAGIINRQYKDVAFLIVGDGKKILVDELKQLTKELGIAGNVIFTGLRHDVPELLQIMDTVISSSYGEGFSNSIAEAMAAGKPVVVTNVGDMAEIVGDGVCGYVVPPKNPVLLAEKIMGVISNEELMKKMGNCSANKVQTNYSLAVLSKEMEDLYITQFLKSQAKVSIKRKIVLFNVI